MAYADYSYYVMQYVGNAISETDFPRLAARASSFIDYYTGGKAAGSSETTKLADACCAIAETYQIIERAKASASSSSGEMASQTVGAYSVSYRSGMENAASAQAELSNIAKMYLAGTGLLYRGVKCRVCSPCCDCL